MTQIAAPQQHVVAQLAQGPEGVQGAQNEHANPPAALGTRHSIGQTIGRIALAIVSLGLSELVISVFKAAVSNEAARARLPENQPPVAAKPSISSLNAAKADSLGSMMTIVDAGKGRATSSLLGKLATMDNAVFSTTLQKAIKNCPTEVTDAKLGELSEKVARDTLTTSIVRNIVDNEPLNANLTARQKSLLMDGYLQSSHVIALKGADTEEGMEALLATVKDLVKEKALSRAASAECKQILFATGIQKFAEMTGLAPDSFSLETWPLENKLNIIASNLDDKAATVEKPYAKASKETLMTAWQPRAEAFFTGRAEAYKSLATMNISEALKTDFKAQCLTAQEPIESDTFTKSMEIAAKMTSDTSLNALLDPEFSIEDKINILETFATKQSQATIAAFGEESLKDMGPDERALIMGISYKMIFAQQPALLAELTKNPAQLASLAEASQESVSNAMEAASDENRDTIERVLGTDQAFQLLRLAVNESAPHVEAPQQADV